MIQMGDPTGLPDPLKPSFSHLHHALSLNPSHHRLMRMGHVTGTGRGGESIYGGKFEVLSSAYHHSSQRAASSSVYAFHKHSSSCCVLQDEIHPELHHTGETLLELCTVLLLQSTTSRTGLHCTLTPYDTRAQPSCACATGAGILSMANAGPNTNGSQVCFRSSILCSHLTHVLGGFCYSLAGQH